MATCSSSSRGCAASACWRSLSGSPTGEVASSRSRSRWSATSTWKREYFLRQQLRAIQKELGETDEREAELGSLRERLDAAKLPEEARKEADRELERLANMPPGAAESTMVRTYLEWMIELPWSKSTE